jgi:hypothetical protein
MKTSIKKLFTMGCLLFLIAMTQAQSISSSTTSGIEITFNYQKIITDRDSSLQINIVINDPLLSQPANYGIFTLNNRNILNRDSLAILLKAKYTVILGQFSYQTLLRHSRAIDQMVTNIRDTISQKSIRSFIFQGIFIFKSLFDGAKRDPNGTGNIDFTVFGGYENALNSFVCEQDIIINIADFRTYLINRKQTDSANVGIDYYLGALQNETATTLNQFQINQKLTTYFSQTQSYAAWPQGGQCGCCANYPGNCYYWSSICLAHDMACQQCQYSWCFSGCVPSSCSGNTIAWYWWVL